MIDWYLIKKLCDAFPRSYISGEGEFIAHSEANQYFILRNCATERDITLKMLSWFSRGACKTEPYRTKAKNERFQKFMLDGINKYLGTSFTKDDMEKIYTYFGNGCNPDKLVSFVGSGYSMEKLEEMVKEVKKIEL